MGKISNKNFIKKRITLFWYFIYYLWTSFTDYSSVFPVYWTSGHARGSYEFNTVRLSVCNVVFVSLLFLNFLHEVMVQQTLECYGALFFGGKFLFYTKWNKWVLFLGWKSTFLKFFLNLSLTFFWNFTRQPLESSSKCQF